MDFKNAEVMDKMVALAERVAVNAAVIMEATGGRMETQAHGDAPWQDQTGNARRSIHYEFSDNGGIITVSIGIGVDYGVYLELSFGGRFRVIQPTVDQAKYQLLRDLQRVLTL